MQKDKDNKNLLAEKYVSSPCRT